MLQRMGLIDHLISPQHTHDSDSDIIYVASSFNCGQTIPQTDHSDKVRRVLPEASIFDQIPSPARHRRERRSRGENNVPFSTGNRDHEFISIQLVHKLNGLFGIKQKNTHIHTPTVRRLSCCRNGFICFICLPGCCCACVRRESRWKLRAPNEQDRRSYLTAEEKLLCGEECTGAIVHLNLNPFPV